MDRRGFTLIEISVVLILMAVAGVIAYPQVRKLFDQARLESAMGDAAAFFKNARNITLNEQRAMGVMVVLDSRKLALVKENGQEEKSMVLEDDISIRKCVFNEQMGDETAQETEEGEMDRLPIVWFYPDGRCTGVALAIRQLAGRELRLRTDNITGAIHVLKPGQAGYDDPVFH